MQTTFAPAIASKPLFSGISQWISAWFNAQPVKHNAAESRVDNIRALQRLARELDDSQPNMAAELRNFAARS